MNLIPALYYTVGRREKVYVIDELDRSMHPLLSKKFLEFYLGQKGITKGQLIFTTHESNLLDLDLLRRDEIYFVEKDKSEASHISSLSDLKPRKDLNIQKGYLNGRFCAIPFFGDASKLGIRFKSKTKS